MLKTFCPKCDFTDEATNRPLHWARQYATVKFAPTTRSGKAHRRSPATSATAEKPASSRKHQPPLDSAQAGVQIRLTLGHTPATSAAMPAARRSSPASASQPALRQRGAIQRPPGVPSGGGVRLAPLAAGALPRAAAGAG